MKMADIYARIRGKKANRAFVSITIPSSAVANEVIVPVILLAFQPDAFQS